MGIGANICFIWIIMLGETLNATAGRHQRGKEDKLATLGKKVERLRQGQIDLMKELSQLGQDINLIKKASQSKFPLDCNAALLRGDWRALVLISPPELNAREVRCDQLTYGGGWTVVVRRSSKHPVPASLKMKYLRNQRNDFENVIIPKKVHEDFNRTWDDYKRGFGDPVDEYWIGNEVIHALTKDGPWEAAVLLQKWDGRKVSAFWDSFRVKNEDNKFLLEVSGYRSDLSTVGDGLTYHNDRAFSTEDSDNDENSAHCAKKYGGGWWFHQCHVSHLTGSHLTPGMSGEHAVHWLPWTGDKESLKSAVLMIRPKISNRSR